MLYHLGGNGPWIEKVEGIVEGGIGVPEGCRVEQVHMVDTRCDSVDTFKAMGNMSFPSYACSGIYSADDVRVRVDVPAR